MILVVDRRHIKSVENEKKSMPFTDVYIGGAPVEILNSRLVYNTASITIKVISRSVHWYTLTTPILLS